MVTVKYAKRCNLCDQPVEIEGFSLTTENTVLVFCCAGCQSIYQLVYAGQKPADANDLITKNNNEED